MKDHELLADLYRARWLSIQGDLAAAELMLDRVAARFESDPRMTRPELFDLYADMAEIQEQLSGVQAANAWLERGMAVAERLAGRDSIQLSRLAEKLGRPAE
ncbi:MAG: hypothetical protein U5Q16_04555 [Gammaproteobacteria bacterium]|nr:hypothetical protein [Gammaproteobacteria bacterium]